MRFRCDGFFNDHFILHFYRWVRGWKNYENRSTFDKVMSNSRVSWFFWLAGYMLSLQTAAARPGLRRRATLTGSQFVPTCCTPPEPEITAFTSTACGCYDHGTLPLPARCSCRSSAQQSIPVVHFATQQSKANQNMGSGDGSMPIK